MTKTPVSAVSDGRSKLFPELLGAAFDTLDASVQRVHRGSGGILHGTASVQRGQGWLARMACTLARLPPSMTEAPLRFELRTGESGEVWTRWFGDAAPMSSRLRNGQGLLLEQLGPATVQFALRVVDRTLQWQAVRLRVFGLPLPRRAFQFEARVHGQDGLYHFAIEARLYGMGLLVRYRGVLHG